MLVNALSWNSYSSCSRLLHLFHMCSYVIVVSSRLLSIYSNDADRRSIKARSVVFVQMFLIFPLFVGWTLTGTIWMFEGKFRSNIIVRQKLFTFVPDHRATNDRRRLCLPTELQCDSAPLALILLHLHRHRSRLGLPPLEELERRHRHTEPVRVLRFQPCDDVAECSASAGVQCRAHIIVRL